MGIDMRGNPLSVDDNQAIRFVEEACHHYLSFEEGALQHISRALAAQPDFIFGHILRALILCTHAQGCASDEAHAALQKAKLKLPLANDREQALFAIVQMLLAGQFHSALLLLDRLLVEYPTDIIAIHIAHQLDLYLGNDTKLRDRIARVMPHWHVHLPGYAHLLGCFAYGQAQLQQFAEAEQLACTALELRQQNGWAICARALSLYMQGKINEGIEWLLSCKSYWSSAVHLGASPRWALGLFYFEKAEYNSILALLDDFAIERPMPLAELGDATSLLWRLYLHGVDIQAPLAIIHSRWLQLCQEGALRYMGHGTVLHAMHAAMAFALGCDDPAALFNIQFPQSNSHTDQTAPAGHLYSEPDADLEFIRCLSYGFMAYCKGQYGETLRQLECVDAQLARLGGNLAQREIIRLTLIEAAFRLGDVRLAQHYVSELTVTRPDSPLGWRLLNRVSGVSARRGQHAA